MKYTVFLKQIRNGSDPMNAEWVESCDRVETRAMALAYAEITARDFGTPAKVVTVAEEGIRDQGSRLIGKVIAYFGPKEHEVGIDYFSFVANGDQYRTDASALKVEVFKPRVQGWVEFRTYNLKDDERKAFYLADSKARYGA